MPAVHCPGSPGAQTPVSTSTPPQPADAARQEIVDRLNALLEAERAGARVARETAAQVEDAATLRLLDAVHRDEVKWCGVLMRVLAALQAAQSPHTGAFHGKAMAIADPMERLAFLNRGQGWVVRKLRELLPLVAQDAIRADLQAMLQAHEENIGEVETRLGQAR